MNSKDLNIIYSIKDAINETDKEVKIKKFYKLLQELTKVLIENNFPDFPKNIPELLKFLKDVPMSAYIKDEDSDDTAIDEYLELTDEFLEKISEENLEEAGQKLMYKLLKFIRESELEEKENIYRDIRKFIIENYYISVRDFELEVKNKFDSDIFKKLKTMYENADDINGEYLICPICGRELNLADNKEERCSRVCNYYMDKYKVKPKKKVFTNRILKLNEGIYSFNLMSSIGEFKIYKKCLERFKDKEITLYPNVDEYDIRLRDYKNNIIVNLDVKDARTPERLVKILMANTKLDKLIDKGNKEFIYIVIPEHREYIYKTANNNGRYLKELKQLLINENINIKVIGEKNLYKEIERIFEDL